MSVIQLPSSAPQIKSSDSDHAAAASTADFSVVSAFSTSPLYSPTATVPGLLAANSVNIVVGSSKVGRMRFLLTQLSAYADPTSPLFLDIPVPHPLQLGCLLCSRDSDRTLYDIRSMDLSNLSAPGAFPIERWHPSRSDEYEPLHPLRQPYAQFTAARCAAGLPRLLLIENLQLLMVGKNIMDEEAVAQFLDELHLFCAAHSCTIIGTVGTPKLKKGEYYPNIPHWIRGCAQWGEGVDTIIGIEEIRATTLNNLSAADAMLYRKIHLKPPGQPKSIRWARFGDTGALYLTDEPSLSPVTGQNDMDRMLSLVDPSQKLTKQDFILWGLRIGISPRTVARWMAACVQFGLLIKEGSSVATTYRRPPAN
jgi:hypothetical protein